MSIWPAATDRQRPNENLKLTNALAREREGTVMTTEWTPSSRMKGDQLVSFISNRHGKFYHSLVLLSDDRAVRIGIRGPYDTPRQAEKWADKWQRLNAKLRKRGVDCILPDVRSVPDDVRAFITTDLTAAIEQIGIDGLLDGKAFGRQFQ
jgi:hypothetical protein